MEETEPTKRSSEHLLAAAIGLWLIRDAGIVAADNYLDGETMAGIVAIVGGLCAIHGTKIAIDDLVPKK